MRDEGPNRTCEEEAEGEMASVAEKEVVAEEMGVVIEMDVAIENVLVMTGDLVSENKSSDS